MFKHKFYKVTALALLGLTACVTQEPSELSAANIDNETVMSTVKPGASVSFTSVSPKNLQVSENGKVVISITDGYDSGTLKLKAVPEAGLRFVSETGLQEFSMAGADTHEWELNVMGAAKGVYYVNIFAEALTPQTVTPQFRSHAVRVQVGNLTDAELKSALKSNGTLSSDGAIVAMDANEVIK